MKSETPTFQDLWELQQAAGRLVGQACTISARHMSNGTDRLRFHREVAYYARGIVSDVEDGKKSLEQGLMEIRKEQLSLLGQSREIAKHGIGIVAGALQIATGTGICYASAGTLCLIAGVPLMAHGANNLYESGRNLLTGKSDTVGPVRKGYQATASAMGHGEREGNIAYGVADIGLSIYSIGRYVNKPDAWRLFRYIHTDRVRAYKTMKPLPLAVDVITNAFTIKSLTGEVRP